MWFKSMLLHMPGQELAIVLRVTIFFNLLDAVKVTLRRKQTIWTVLSSV